MALCKLRRQQQLHCINRLEGLSFGLDSRLFNVFSFLGQVSIRVLIIVFKTSHYFDSVSLDLFGVNFPGSFLSHQSGSHLTILYDG